METKRSSSGKFVSHRICASRHMHDELSISFQTDFKRIRDMSKGEIKLVCDYPNLTLTPQEKSERKLIFCQGCLEHCAMLCCTCPTVISDDEIHTNIEQSFQNKF